MTTVIEADEPGTLARLTRAVARSTGAISRPVSGHRLFPLYAIVHHRGRRSGAAYAVPVAIRASDEAFTIALPWGTRTQWVRNVLSAGGCTVRWRGADHQTTDPRIIGLDEASAAFHPVQRAVLRLAGIRTFVRLDRVDATA